MEEDSCWICVMDGQNEVETRNEGPSKQHFRDTDLQHTYTQKERVWTQIVSESIQLPTPYIRLYDTN